MYPAQGKATVWFPSVLIDKFNDSSDIDFIVDFAPVDLAQYADNYYDLKFSLESIFDKPVDLLEEQAIKNPYFRKVVDNQRQLIYGHWNKEKANKAHELCASAAGPIEQHPLKQGLRLN